MSQRYKLNKTKKKGVVKSKLNSKNKFILTKKRSINKRRKYRKNNIENNNVKKNKNKFLYVKKKNNRKKNINPNKKNVKKINAKKKNAKKNKINNTDIKKNMVGGFRTSDECAGDISQKLLGNPPVKFEVKKSEDSTYVQFGKQANLSNIGSNPGRPPRVPSDCVIM